MNVILQFIRELAAYEKMGDLVVVAEAIFALFGGCFPWYNRNTFRGLFVT